MNQSSYTPSHFMDVFVKKPVVAIVVSIIICLAGVWGAGKISVLQFPKIEAASLVITTPYTGASAETVKGYVSEPIERIAATIPGVEYIESESVAGYSTVTAWLKLNENSTLALAELNTRLGQIRSELPSQAEDPSVSVSRTDRSFAVFYLDVSSGGRSLTELSDYLDRNVVPSLTTIKGVQRVDLEGGRTPAMRVHLDADRLALYDLSAAEIFDALAQNNIISTLGFSENQQQRFDIIADSQLQNVQDFEQLVVAEFSGTLVRLKDVATLFIGSEEPISTGRLNNENTVYLAVWPLPGANEIEIGDQLYTVIEDVNKRLPQGMKIGFGFDGTLYMRAALKEIMTTLVETILIVGIVVILLMGSFRVAIVPLITIPISILGALAAITMAGFTINLLTVLAIVLSVGLVVDDAIVVVENVARLMREGLSPSAAALKSSRQLFVPVVSMTLTLAAVYSPIGFLTGLTGALFREFAFTLAIAVIISGIVAVTLSPIMSAYVSPEGGKEGPFTLRINKLFNRIQNRYARLLKHVYRWRWQVLFSAITVGLLALPFYQFSAKELAPVEDQGNVVVIAKAPPQSNLTYNVANFQPVVDNLLEVEGAFEMWQIVTANGGFGGLNFVPSEQRDFTTQEIVPDLFQRFDNITGLQMLPTLPSALPSAGQFDVELIVKSNEPFVDMDRYAKQIVAAAFRSGLVLYADTELKIDLPQIRLSLKREQIADLGMTVADVSNQLSILLSDNFVNRYNADGKAYQVIPTISDAYRAHPETLLNLTIKSPDGDLIPVASVAELNWQVQPRTLTTFNQQNSFRFFAGASPGVTKTQLLEELEKIIKEIIPANYNLDYAGESRQIKQEGSTLVGVLGVSVIVVYLILAMQFNSFRDPLVILVGSVPLALSGALLWPFLELSSINIYSQIGLITLIALIAKNGILIVEFANRMQEQGKNKLDAVVAGATGRLRPILMTTAATVLGHFPLVLVTGAGAEARNSIGIILVAGMIIGTVFTLLVLPVFYVWLASEKSPIEDSDAAESKSTATLPEPV